MFSRPINSLADEIAIAILTALTAAWDDLSLPVPGDAAIIDPQNPRGEKLYEQAMTGGGITIVPIIATSFESLITTYTIGIAIEVAWKQHAAVFAGAARHAEQWAEWAGATVSQITTIETIDGLDLRGLEEQGGDASSERHVATLIAHSITDIR